MSNCTVTPGYVLGTGTPGEKTTNAKLNLLAQPSVSVPAASITDAEIANVSGVKIVDGTIPVSALGSDIQTKFGFKNYAPNPAFDFWPAGTSAATTSLPYGYSASVPVTYTFSKQDTTAGENDSLLGAAQSYLQLVTSTTSSSTGYLRFFIPNVRLFSSKTITVSFVTKQLTGTVPSYYISAEQYFGTGGSPSSNVATSSSNFTSTSASWTQVSASLTLPTINGKTLGSNGDDGLYIKIAYNNFSTSFTQNFANVQVEFGNAATTFENGLARNTGSDITTNNAICNGRLTLTSGDPLQTADVASATTVYFTPYMGNRISLWDGNVWRVVPFNEIAFSISGSANSSVYDIFAYWNGFQVVLEKLIWTSQTARATAVTYQDGILCKSGDKTRRLLGSYGTTSSGVCSIVRYGSSAGGANNVTILLDNIYNRIETLIYNQDTTATSWNYNSTTWRNYNGAATPNNYVSCLQSYLLDYVRIKAIGTSSANYDPMIGIGTSSSSVITNGTTVTSGGGGGISTMVVDAGTNILGVTTYYINERNRAAAGNSTFWGSANATAQGLSIQKRF